MQRLFEPRPPWRRASAVAVLCLVQAACAQAGAPLLGNCPLFPAAAIFNHRIDDVAQFPVDPRSRQWIDAVGAGKRFHADFGRSENADQPRDYYGIPFNVRQLPASEGAWPVVSFDIVDERDANGKGVPEESDCAVLTGGAVAIQRGCEAVPPAARRFPFSDDLKAEHGSCNDPAACGDRHILVVEQGACRLWESYFAYKINGAWRSYSTAAWDLNSYAMRPDRWTSGDAAGLPILPLLARAEEADTGAVRHALRVTFRDAVLDKRYVWPARHAAGRATPGGIPFGALLRLRSNFEIPGHWTRQARVLAQAMREYGLYVADIGSDFYVQGEPNRLWSAQTISQLQTLKMESFEFVDIGSITSAPGFDANSYRAKW